MTIGLLLVVIDATDFSQTLAKFPKETATLARLVVDLPTLTTFVFGVVFSVIVAVFVAFHFSHLL